jgi:thiazole/oxazole-forming peptide maturase SagD family component
MTDLAIRSVPKRSFGVNFHSISPESTVERAKASLSRLPSQPAPALVNASLADAPSVSIYSAGQAFSKYNAWGKGLSPESSQASALMEFVERFSAETPVFGAHNEPILSPRKALPFRSHGFDTLCAYNFQYALYDDLENLSGRPLLWSKAYSLTHAEEVWLPTSRIWIRFPQPHVKDYCCTNGLSANNTREEAILQGICEVIERHTLHLHFLNKVRPNLSKIPLNRIANPSLKEAIFSLQEAGWVIVANLHRTGLPFHTTSVWMQNPKSQYEYRTEGSYIHFATACSIEASLSRCITECVQSMSAERIWRTSNPEIQLRLSRSLLEDLELRLISESSEDSKDAVLRATDDFKDDIEAAVSTLQAFGIEVLVADCTHPDLGIPVVKVFCPGLQPNFLLHKTQPFDSMAIVSNHLENHLTVWNHAKRSTVSSTFS